MSLQTYLNNREIAYSPAPLAKLLERISCPTTKRREFIVEGIIEGKEQTSLRSYIVNGIRFTYKIFNTIDQQRKSLEESLNNPEIETIKIKNFFGEDDKRGTEIRIRRVRNEESIIIRYKLKNRTMTKEFKTDNVNAIETIERYIRSLMPKL